MKICQVTSKHSRYDQRVFKKVAVSACSNGFDSFLICADGKPDETADGVCIHSIKTKKSNRLLSNLFGWKRFKRECLKLGADLYQIHDPDLLKLCLFLKRKGKKVVFDSHENYENIIEKQWLPRFLRKPLQKSYLRIEKRVLSKIDGVITVTPFIERRLSTFNQNTVVVSNFPILKKEKNHHFDNFEFCYGGNYGSYNHAIFLDALEHFEGRVRFNLVLNCSDDELNTLSSHKAWKYVNFTRGPVPFEQLEKIYDKSAFGMVLLKYSINYNYKEGSLGVIKLFEIMSKGMPVLCSDFDVWKEIMDEYKCGVCVNPNSLEEIINSIQFFLDNPDLVKRYGENARRAVETRFNWLAEEKKLISFYKSILKSS